MGDDGGCFMFLRIGDSESSPCDLFLFESLFLQKKHGGRKLQSIFKEVKAQAGSTSIYASIAALSTTYL